MPYVYMDELGEGMEEADVVTRDEYNIVVGERDTFEQERDANAATIESLQNQLSDAKTKFANAFLSSPETAKRKQADDIARDGRATSYSELFNGRNAGNAN